MIRQSKLLFSTVAAWSVLATMALAADVAVPASNWTGFYLGIGGGGSTTLSETDAGGYSDIDFFGPGSIPGGFNNGDLSDGDPGAAIYDGDTQFGSFSAECDDASFCYADALTAATIGNGSVPANIADEITELLNGGDGGDPRGGNDTGSAGAMGIAEAGFDYQFGSRLLVGLNASFNFANLTVENSAYGGADTDAETSDEIEAVSGDSIASLSTELELGNSWTLGGRMGFLLNESNLLFASGGYVSTKAKLSADYSATTEAYAEEDDGDVVDLESQFDVSSSDDDWLDGYYIGGGLESMMTENVSFKLEYRFADLGSIKTSKQYSGDIDVQGANGFAAAGVTATADPVVHSVRATLNWRF